MMNIAMVYRVNESTIRTVHLNRDKVEQVIRPGGVQDMGMWSYVANQVLMKTEKIVMKYVCAQMEAGMPTDTFTIRAKARETYASVACMMNIDNPPPFNTSKGWCWNFCSRKQLRYASVQGKMDSADSEVAEAYPAEFRKLVEDGGYSVSQIFNMNGTGLYWKRLPSTTFQMKDEKSAQWYKA